MICGFIDFSPLAYGETTNKIRKFKSFTSPSCILFPTILLIAFLFLLNTLRGFLEIINVCFHFFLFFALRPPMNGEAFSTFNFSFSPPFFEMYSLLCETFLQGRPSSERERPLER